MPVVKKVGSDDAIMPTLEELFTIQRIKRRIAEIVENCKKGKAECWPTDDVRDDWLKIHYYKQSKRLTSILDSIRNECIFFDYLEEEAEWDEDFIRRSRRNSWSSLESRHRELDWYYEKKILKVWPDQFDNPERLYSDLYEIVEVSMQSPVRLSLLGTDEDWIFNGYHYAVGGPYTDDQLKLLIVEEFDKERRYFERLKQKHTLSGGNSTEQSRPRIPENVRVEVWRRDGGKCVRCGNRERLEYDHIIPVSKGGSNTARNIELLCEECNRRKGNKIE